ncbi:MAG TPA: hypothetical protein PKA06_10010, partial [Gemmatales bacterium]|nr:hypothetical protein [Gemmatales bacterium]
EGLAISQNYCASSWKTELLEKAAHSYPSQELALMALPSFISAFSESYLRKNDPQVAVAVFNMADALCNAQQAPKAGRVSWTGGFMLAQKKDLTQPPSASDSARAISALCDAYRVAKQSGDVQRAEKYKASATAGVQFLTTLQFTAMGIDHLAEDFRPQVLGAFRSHPDSAIIRLQDTAECVLAVSSYLSDVCGLPLNLTPLPQK